MSEQQRLHSKKLQEFRQFLLANSLRQTRERYAILEAVNDIQGIFSVEELEAIMEQRHFPVSKATIYATTQLLVQANLLMRHPFSSSSALFECVTDSHPRCYQICNRCHRITRITSKELAANVEAYHPRRFGVSFRVTYIYGTCPKCEAAMNRTLKKLAGSFKAPVEIE